MAEEKVNLKKLWDEYQNLLEMNLEVWKDEELKNSRPGPWYVIWKAWSYLKRGTYPKKHTEVADEEFTKKLIGLFRSYSEEIKNKKYGFADDDSRNIFSTTLANIFVNSIISFSISILDLILLSEPGSTLEWRQQVITRLQDAQYGNEMFRDKIYDATEWFSREKVSKENYPIPKYLYNYMGEQFIGSDICTWEKLKPLFTEFKQI